MHRQYLHVEGRTTAYFDTAPGRADLPVAALIHGFPLDASMWEAQLRHPPPGWRLIAPDLRGFGGSTDVEASAPSIDDYADDVVDVLRALDIPGAVVAGLSMGGYVTFAILRRAPALVRAIVLADTRAGADSPEAREGRRAMLALLDREGPAGVATQLLPRLLSEHTRQTRPDVESGVRRLTKQQSAQAIRGALVRLMTRPDATSELAGCAVPALVIVGEHDAITPVDEARRLAGGLPDAELAVIPHAGHMANIEQPDAFSSALAAFLARL
ncbi:MAG: alpha/beta fold hydrolase [Acidobacteriota bacterium]